jgi:hypothetical protein
MKMINKNKMTFVAGILLVLTILNISSILALGVTPGRNTLSYSSDLEDNEFSFTVLNTEEETIHLSFSTEGDLKDGIILHQDSAKMLPYEESKKFTYSLDIDENSLKSGENKGQITIRQLPDDDELASFSALPAVSTEIVVLVPYPGKYVESNIRILEAGKNETTEFLIPVINRGVESIDLIKADINISFNEDEIDFIETNAVNLETMQRKDLSAEWLANVPMGVYLATIDLIYDDEIATYYKSFKVGEIDIGIFDIFADDFELGNIVKLSVLVENMWAEDLKEVYANLILYDGMMNKIVDVKSAPYDVPALDSLRIPIHWDTSGIEKGKYKGKIRIVSKEYSTERYLKVEITDTGIGLELESGGFVFEKETDYFWLWITILGILIAGIIIAIIIFKNFPKK